MLVGVACKCAFHHFQLFALHSFFQSFGISLVFQGLLEISNDQQSDLLIYSLPCWFKLSSLVNLF